jgi:uncharacterized repeat protein (TIGR03806 family)
VLHRAALPFVLALACRGEGPPARPDPTATAPDPGTDSGVGPAPTGPWLTERPSNPSCVAPARPRPSLGVTTEAAWPAVPASGAVQVLQPPDAPETVWVVRQRGVVERFADDPAVTATEVVVDLTDRVNDEGGELGLLALAFHPDWDRNRQAFVYYTGGSRLAPISVISRFTSTDGGATLDPGTEEEILRVDQPYGNHNGGMLHFGPDGYLYFGFGDGGGAGDPLLAGQDPWTLLGKFVRIDVDGGAPYEIPADNPFASGAEALPEIYALGFRNPWRWSFDAPTGQMWVADVGQNLVEEVDLVAKGGNYGWNVMEGDTCFGAAACDRAGLALPVATTLHADGHASITGGFVYRGRAIPDLVGKYVFGDYVSGQTWYLDTDPVDGAFRKEELLSGVTALASIGLVDDELVFVSRSRGFLRLVPDGEPAPSTLPATLPETGCFTPDGEVDAAVMVPYQVAHPFWSDGADKTRWLAIPDGATIGVDEDGALAFPIGSVLVKEFVVGGRRVESRLFVRHEDGGWAGYTYAWGDDGASRLLPAGLATTGGGGEPWQIPSRGECLRCHNGTTGGPLGLRLDQLDLDARQPNGWVENQVDQLVRLAMLDPPSDRPGPLPALTDAGATLEARARAYLDVNCAVCHQPGGPAGGALDLRVGVPLSDTGLCGPPIAGDLGVAGARVLAPGDPAASVLSLRMGRRDSAGMPPLGSTAVDALGKSVIDDWITSLAECP